MIGRHFDAHAKVQTAVCKDNSNSKSRAATYVKFTQINISILPLISGDWKRYRDDTWDIEENVNVKDLVQFMTAKVLKDKIKVTLEYSEAELVFLDTKVHLKNGFLIPEIYSKPTDSHEYLNPKSSHPPNVVKNIPYSVALRVRRNCSDRIEDDTLFKKNMINYEAYLLNS